MFPFIVYINHSDAALPAWKSSRLGQRIVDAATAIYYTKFFAGSMWASTVATAAVALTFLGYFTRAGSVSVPCSFDSL
jgi:hypothetical protein